MAHDEGHAGAQAAQERAAEGEFGQTAHSGGRPRAAQGGSGDAPHNAALQEGAEEDPQAIEAAARKLALRAYLYSFFHVAFGATPSPGEVEALCTPQAAEALSSYAEHADAQGDAAGAQAFRTCEARLGALGAEAAADAEGAAETLKSAYTRLFLVPGESYVHPWESPYIGKETMVFQPSTLDVRQRYRAFGFQAAEYKHFPEDHVAMMTHFMGLLAQRAFSAYLEGDDAEAARLLAAQRDFAAGHLGGWVAAVAGKVGDADAGGFYADAGGFYADAGGFYAACANALVAFLADETRFLAAAAPADAAAVPARENTEEPAAAPEGAAVAPMLESVEEPPDAPKGAGDAPGSAREKAREREACG